MHIETKIVTLRAMDLSHSVRRQDIRCEVSVDNLKQLVHVHIMGWAVQFNIPKCFILLPLQF